MMFNNKVNKRVNQLEDQLVEVIKMQIDLNKSTAKVVNTLSDKVLELSHKVEELEKRI